jgi:hypothetical protein
MIIGRTIAYFCLPAIFANAMPSSTKPANASR